MLRSYLYLAAQTHFRAKGESALRIWALNVAKSEGKKNATVALARKMAVVMHRMWMTETPFT